MSAVYRPEVGTWWRFDRYVVKDGAIQPAPGAKLTEYDLWGEYEKTRQRGGGQEAPYQTLLTLLQQTKLDASTRDLTPDSASLLCKWCTSWGLLGIMLQEYDHLPCRFLWDHETIPSEDEFAAAGSEGLRIDPHAVGTWLWNPPQGWAEMPNYAEPIGNYREGPQRAPSGILYRYVRNATEYVEFGSYRQPIVDYPLTPGFWRDYQEPVLDFLERARDLTGALKYFYEPVPFDIRNGGWALSKDGELELDLRYLDFWVDVTYLNELTASAGFALQIDADGRPHEVIAFRSLLSSFALMILYDIAGGRKVNLCANCGAPFTSTSPKAAYCSTRCRNTAQKRRQRHPELREKKGGRQ